LRQFSDQWVIDDRFDAALIAHFDETTDVAPLLAGGPFVADRYPLAGWWRVTAGPADLVLELRMRGPGGWQDVFTIRWSRAAGWQ
jgi:hypothetical protein